MAMRQTRTIDREQAETIAFQALAFLAADPKRLTRFLQLTGMQGADLGACIHEAPFQASVLNHLLGDESLLLVFASETGTSPTDIAPAYAVLAGPDGSRHE